MHPMELGWHPLAAWSPGSPIGRIGKASRHTDEVEVQKDPVARHENLPISVFHRLQERVNHLCSFNNQLLKQNTNCSRGEGSWSTGSFIHSLNIQVLSAGYNSGCVLGSGETKINKPIPSKFLGVGEP